MDALTDRQRDIYAHLRTREGASLVELATRLGIHYTTLKQHLEALERKGYLTLETRGVGRSPVVRLTSTAEGVPVVGRIAAGPLSEALEHPEGYLRLPGYPEGFGLRVHGNSMADMIQEGDVVLLQKRPPKSGEICAVRIDQSEATLKYLDRHPNHPETVRLRPHNPEYPTAEVDAERVAVDGVFSALLRGDVIEVLFQGAEMN